MPATLNAGASTLFPSRWPQTDEYLARLVFLQRFVKARQERRRLRRGRDAARQAFLRAEAEAFALLCGEDADSGDGTDEVGNEPDFLPESGGESLANPDTTTSSLPMVMVHRQVEEGEILGIRSDRDEQVAQSAAPPSREEQHARHRPASRTETPKHPATSRSAPFEKSQFSFPRSDEESSSAAVAPISAEEEAKPTCVARGQMAMLSHESEQRVPPPLDAEMSQRESAQPRRGAADQEGASVQQQTGHAPLSLTGSAAIKRLPIAFAVADVVELAESDRRHLEEQQRTSLAWLVKDFHDTLRYICEKDEDKARRCIRYDEVTACELLAEEERRCRTSFARTLERHAAERQERLREHVALLPATVAKLEKLMRREATARGKIETAQKSYLHAFHDEFAADLRRTCSFSLTTMQLSATTLPAASTSHREKVGSDLQTARPSAEPGAASTDAFKPSAERTARETPARKTERFLRAASASSTRRTDRRTVFMDELPDPRQLEVDTEATRPARFLGLPAAVTPAAEDARTRTPEWDGADPDEGIISFCDVAEDELLAGSCTQRPSVETRKPAGAAEERNLLGTRMGKYENPPQELSVEALKASGGTPQQQQQQQLDPNRPSIKSIFSASSSFARSDAGVPSNQSRTDANDGVAPPAGHGAPLSSPPRNAAPTSDGLTLNDDREAATAMQSLLAKEYGMHPEKHYRLRLRDFVDVVLVVGVSTSATIAPLRADRTEGGPDALEESSPYEKLPAHTLWTHPALLTAIEEYLADKQHGVDGALLEGAESTKFAWVYVEDCCAALVHGLRRAAEALLSSEPVKESAAAAGGTGTASREEQLHPGREMGQPSEVRKAPRLPVEAWTTQLVTHGFQRLMHEQGLPHRYVVASVFDLLASAAAAPPPPGATVSPATATGRGSDDGRDCEGTTLRLTDRRLPFRLFKNVFLCQLKDGSAQLDALIARTSIEFVGSAIMEHGVPYLAFSAFLHHSGPQRESVSLSQLRRTLEPMLQPQEVQHLMSPYQGRNLKRKQKLLRTLRPSLDITMLFVHRGADCIARVAAVHAHMAHVQRQCCESIRPIVHEILVAESSSEANETLSEEALREADTALPFDMRSEGAASDADVPIRVLPGKAVSITGCARGRGNAAVLARGGPRRAFLRSIQAYFYGILEHATEGHRKNVAAKCLLLLVFFSTWMEQDEEAAVQRTAAQVSAADGASGSPRCGPRKRQRRVDRFWTRRIFQLAGRYYKFIGKIDLTGAQGGGKDAPLTARGEPRSEGRGNDGNSPRRRAQSLDDLDSILFSEDPSPVNGLTSLCAKIAVLFYDFFLNLRDHRNTHFPGFMKDKPMPTLEELQELQQEIRFFHQQSKGNRGLDPASSSATVKGAGADEAAAQRSVSGVSAMESSCFAGFLAEDELAEDATWIRTPVDANVPYTEYPNGPDSLKRVTEVVSRCLNVVWLSYSAELDGVVTFYAASYFEDGPALDLTVFTKTDGDTTEMERVLEEAALHAHNFNALMDTAMAYLQAVWTSSRWIRTVAASTLGNRDFGVPCPTTAGTTATSPQRKRGRRWPTERNPFPQNYEDCAKRLAGCIIAVWPYQHREKCPFHRVPEAVFRRGRRVAENHRGDAAATHISSCSPKAGALPRTASLASFASSVRSFNAGMRSLTSAAAGRSVCGSLAQRSYASLFGDIALPSADVSRTSFNASAASTPMAAAAGQARRQGERHGRRGGSRGARSSIGGSGSQRTAAAPAQPRRPSTQDSEEGRTDAAGFDPASRTEPPPTRSLARTLAPLSHSVDPVAAEGTSHRRALYSPKNPEYVRRNLSNSRLLTAVPTPRVREFIQMLSRPPTGASATGRATDDLSAQASSGSSFVARDRERSERGETDQLLRDNVSPSAREQSAVARQDSTSGPTTGAATVPMQRGRAGRGRPLAVARQPTLKHQGKRAAAEQEQRQLHDARKPKKAAAAAGNGKKAPRKPTVHRQLYDTCADLTDPANPRACSRRR